MFFETQTMKLVANIKQFPIDKKYDQDDVCKIICKEQDPRKSTPIFLSEDNYQHDQQGNNCKK